VREGRLGIEWKLDDMKGKYYAGRPMNGSIRRADLPPFLAELHESHSAAHMRRRCTSGATHKRKADGP